MAQTPRPGPDPLSQAATYGGPGWSTRGETHAEDVAAGAIWARCGVRSEVGRLRQVVLAWPPDSLDYAEPPDHWLMLARPDREALRAEALGLVDFYRSLGVTVHLARGGPGTPPNFLFQRDLFFATPEGVVLARPASPRRAAEVRAAAAALAAAGVPILMTPRGGALFEGADALWVSPDEVFVGLGVRTNRAGFEQLSGLLGELGVRATAVPVPPGTQHLLGVLDFADTGLVVTRVDRISEALAGPIRERGYRLLVVPTIEEVTRGGAANFVALSPGRVAMPLGCPETERRYRDAGLAVETVGIKEYLKAAGGLGCLTGVLERELL